jgi:hypothetical protein
MKPAAERSQRRRTRACAAAAVVACGFGARVAAAAPLDVVVVSAAGDAVPDPSEKLVRLGTAVVLHAALRLGAKDVVCDVPRVVLAPHGPAVAARPPRPADGPLAVRWFRVEVAGRSYQNTNPAFHWDEIAYQDVPLPACDDSLRCEADLHATLLGDRGGLGTGVFRARVTLGAREGASPGAERKWRGGLPDGLARVTVRRDDTYLGFLTELFNTPYIWGSAGDPAKVHQAERRIGSDCADFVTYGVRRLGHDLPYTSTWEIEKFTRRLYESKGPGDDGVYRDGAGRPIPVGEGGVHPGDLLLFPRHVGAFVRDEPPLGVLSAGDVMIHTCWAPPAEQPLDQTDYGHAPVKVLRWKVLSK